MSVVKRESFKINRFAGLTLLLSCLAWAGPAVKDPWFGHQIKQIEVNGLKRIEKTAVLAKLSSKVEHDYDPERIREDISLLYGMGYFDEITFHGDALPGDQVKLVVDVKERPAVSKIDFDGNEKIETSDLKEVIKIKEWSILDENKVRQDVGLIQKHYEDKGYYLTKVSYEIKPTKEGEVELTYKINDFDKVLIKKITILGNKKFSDEQIKAVFQETKEGNALSFLSSSGSFKESSFNRDLQILSLWYYDHGYVDFKADRPVVTISDDKKYMYITLSVSEGEQYSNGTVDFAGDLLFTKEELAQDANIKPGEIFSYTKRNLEIQRLTEKYEDLGYAFVNVIPKMVPHKDTLTLDWLWEFEKGNLVYFGEINISGNTKTHDKVIRRELKFAEGELFNGTRLRQSKEKVEALGFFAPGEVVFNRVSPKGNNKVLNIDITLKERSTGTITLGAGYGTGTGLFVQGNIQDINLLGRGYVLGFNVQAATGDGALNNNVFTLGFTNPYAFDTRWSLGGDVYFSNSPIPDRYNVRKLGASATVGRPLADFVNLYMTYKNEGTNIYNVNPASKLSSDLLAAEVGVTSSARISLTRDHRNNRFETSDGSYQNAYVELAGIGGDKKFVKWGLNNRFFRRIVGDLVFRHNVEFGHIAGFTDRRLAASDKFLLGGQGSLRGFKALNVGPQTQIPDPNDPNASITTDMGGTIEAFSMFELEYPLIREAGLKLVTFFDIGNSWMGFRVQPGQDFLRMDVGMGIRWFSPIGPLRFEFGWPINPHGTEGMEFVFWIGPPF